jgi:hypothetical protein
MQNKLYSKTMTSTFPRLFNRRKTQTQPLPGFTVTAPPLKGIVFCIKDQSPNFSVGDSCCQTDPYKPDFGIIFHLMENSNNSISTNQLIYNF